MGVLREIGWQQTDIRVVVEIIKQKQVFWF